MKDTVRADYELILSPCLAALHHWSIGDKLHQPPDIPEFPYTEEFRLSRAPSHSSLSHDCSCGGEPSNHTRVQQPALLPCLNP